MSTERKIISVPTSPELNADLDILSDADHRPKANYIRLVLEQHVKEQRKKRPALFEKKREVEPVNV